MIPPSASEGRPVEVTLKVSLRDPSTSLGMTADSGGLTRSGQALSEGDGVWNGARDEPEALDRPARLAR